MSHPNRYFERSRELERLANGEAVPVQTSDATPGSAPVPMSKKEEDPDDSMQLDDE